MSQRDAAGDGAVPPGVRSLERLDRAVGGVEQAVLAASLAGLIAVSFWQLVSGLALGQHATWPYEVIRYAVFFVAMAGAALAAQRNQMMTMDALTRLLAPRRRVVLRVALSLVVLVACLLLVQGGLAVRERTTNLNEEYDVISPGLGMLALPIGAALIALHTALHAAIDVLYLVAGRLPPEGGAVRAH